MRQSAFREQRERIMALAEKWVKPTGGGWWSIELRYCAKRKEYAQATGNDGDTSAATCCTDWRYRTALIHFNCPLWRHLSDDEAEKAFVHELMHIFLDELVRCGDDKQDHLERVCKTLADAFVWGVNARPEVAP